MQAYANLHLRRSYEYLLSASYFNNYQTNRQGFSKLFRKLADDSWAKTIDLIKHITTRGKFVFLVSIALFLSCVILDDKVGSTFHFLAMSILVLNQIKYYNVYNMLGTLPKKNIQFRF